MVIQSGLEPGETVVTEGQLRLAPGSRIVVRDGRGEGGGRNGKGGEGRRGGRKGEGAPDGAPGAAPKN
jgi:multidrug efflux system membrane fusion protein